MSTTGLRARRLPAPWMAVALWAGLALLGARSVLLFAMERAHGSDLARARLRIADALPAAALECALAGLVTCALLAAALRIRGRLARALALGIAVVAGGVLCSAVLGGWLGADGSPAVGRLTSRGRRAAQALVALGFALAGAACFGVARWRTRSAWSSRAALAWILPGLALLVVPLGGRALYGRIRGAMVLREVAAELLAAPFAVVRDGGGAPRVGVITPARHYTIDGADLPALVLPPPGEVRFAPAGESGVLRVRAGIDWSVLGEHAEALRDASIRFRVLVNGAEVAAADVRAEHVRQWYGSEWAPLGGADGIALARGDVLALSTALLGPDGAERAPPAALDAGFGELLLERPRRLARARSSAAHPSIVLVLMDTQRADRLGTYGYARPTSPELDALAARGLVFEEAFSTASWTWPATASVLTGLEPEEHGVSSEASCHLAEGLDTLAEGLQRAGYTTAGFSANPLIVPDKRFDQGFEYFDSGKGAMRKSAAVVPAALAWLRAAAGTRFFLYLHLVDPHSPLEARPEGRALLAEDVPADFSARAMIDYSEPLFAGCGHTETGERATERCVPAEHQRWISELYDACTWSGDYWLGRVLAELDALGLTGETVIAFTSDHGEELFDHGFVTHGHGLHRELVRVPLVLAGPGVPVGVRSRASVSNRHLAPTLLRLAGAQDGLAPGSLDLLSAGAADDVVLYSTHTGFWNGKKPVTLRGLRSGGFVLHWAPEGAPWGSATATPGGDLRLFDLARDPLEQRDVGSTEPERATELRAELERRSAALAARRRAPAVPAGEATLELLRDIGYLGD